MVSKVLKLAAVPAGLVVSSYGLYAVSDREARGDRLDPQKLSLYAVPPQGSRFIAEQPGRVQSAVSAVRSALWPLVTWTQNACSSLRTGVEDAVHFGKDSYIYLKNPPPEFLPRAGIISVSGLAGLILARKGSRLKKVAYPLGLATLGASLCYPAQAVIVTKVTSKRLYSAGHGTYNTVSSLWKAKPQKEEAIPAPSEDVKETAREEDKAAAESPAEHGTQDLQEPPISPEPPTTSPVDPEEASTASVYTELPKDVKFQPPPELVDHGQSNPEDVDLYSTRS